MLSRSGLEHTQVSQALPALAWRVWSASRGPALAQTLSADTVEPGSACSSQAQVTPPASGRILELPSGNLAARAHAGMEGNVDQMRKGPTMASCSWALHTPTVVAHDAPQLSAPVSDRAPQVQWLLLAIAPNHALREGRRALRQEEVRSRRRAERIMAGGPSAESAARWTHVAAQLLAHRRAAFRSFLRSTAELPERRAVRRSAQRTPRAGISNAETGA